MIKPKKIFNFEMDGKKATPPRLEKQVAKSRKIKKPTFKTGILRDKISRDKLIIIAFVLFFIIAIILTWKFGGTESNIWFNRRNV